MARQVRAARVERTIVDLSALTFDAARALEGTTFRVELADRTVVSLTLDQVQSYETRQSRRSPTARTAGAARRDPFSLYFLGPPSPVLPQAIYTFRGDATTFETLFIVPVDRDGEATEYEAVFS